MYSKISPCIVEEQHVFVDGKSTVTNLCTFLQYASEVIDDHGQVDVLYTDISKAFDRIDHGILLRKLQDIGFSDYQRKLYVLQRQHVQSMSR
ncbi:hypothetical protein Trydic_g23344 [Trypoxylus dichotomus]